jgi:hypothetical protein
MFLRVKEQVNISSQTFALRCHLFTDLVINEADVQLVTEVKGGDCSGSCQLY